MTDPDNEPAFADLLLSAPNGELYTVASHILMLRSGLAGLRDVDVDGEHISWVVLHDADDDLMDRIYHRGILRHLEDGARVAGALASETFFVLAAFPQLGRSTRYTRVRINHAVPDTSTPWPRLICINPGSTLAKELAVEVLKDIADYGEMLRFHYETEEVDAEATSHWRDLMSTVDRLDMLRRCGASPRLAFIDTPPPEVLCELDHAVRE